MFLAGGCLVLVYFNATEGNPIMATALAACVGLNVHTYMRRRP